MPPGSGANPPRASALRASRWRIGPYSIRNIPYSREADAEDPVRTGFRVEEGREEASDRQAHGQRRQTGSEPRQERAFLGHVGPPGGLDAVSILRGRARVVPHAGILHQADGRRHMHRSPGETMSPGAERGAAMMPRDAGR